MRMLVASLVCGCALLAASPGVSAMRRAKDWEIALALHDWPTALRKMRPLAEAGDIDANFMLGAVYFNGWGVKQDDVQAANFYRVASAKGYHPAQSILASLYANGKGVPQDFAEAARLYRLAAEQGDDWSADTALAQLYANGQGVQQDDAEAVHWYRLPAEAGRDDAETGLGLMYYAGRGVPQNFELAASWFRKAADQGYADGQTNLGAAYANGRGVPKDAIQAYKWLTLAAGRYGSAESDARSLALRNRDIVARSMTTDQINEAQREAAAWKANASSGEQTSSR